MTNVADVSAAKPGSIHSYNLCPSNGILAVLEEPRQRRTVAVMKWGLEPRFTPAHHLSTINARVEGLKSSRVFGPLIHSNRCVIILEAFYEWDQKPKEHTPYIIRYHDLVKERAIPLEEGSRKQVEEQISDVNENDDSFLPENVSPLLVAGLYDKNPKSGELSCTILTTVSKGPVSEIHSRMPVFLTPETAKTWLEAKPFDEVIDTVMRGCNESAKALECIQVSQLVNSVANKGREVTLSVAESKKRSYEKGLGRFFGTSPDKKLKK